LLGLSEISNDIRDVVAAADEGHEGARLAIDHLVHSIRHWIGAFLVELGGVDALVFTAGIGENHPRIREAACNGLESFGIRIDSKKNAACRASEADIAHADSPARVFVIPANEELVLAHEVYRKLSH
jgi:acetate kinase